jgi:hypothetical protein
MHVHSREMCIEQVWLVAVMPQKGENHARSEHTSCQSTHTGHNSFTAIRPCSHAVVTTCPNRMVIQAQPHAQHLSCPQPFSSKGSPYQQSAAPTQAACTCLPPSYSAPSPSRAGSPSSCASTAPSRRVPRQVPPAGKCHDLHVSCARARLHQVCHAPSSSVCRHTWVRAAMFE